jgi:hypothetical protein
MSIKNMKSLFILFKLLFFFSSITHATQTKLFVFNVVGESYIIREGIKSRCIINKTLAYSDSLEVVDGYVVIVKTDLSKAVIGDPKKYSFNELLNSFTNVQSKESRFFTYLLSLITEKKVEITSPGGVVRGQHLLDIPIDSSIIVGNVLPIHLNDSIKVDYEIWNADLHLKVEEKSFIHSHLIMEVESKWWVPGKFLLLVKIGEYTISRVFYIPDSEQRLYIENIQPWIFNNSEFKGEKESRDFLLSQLSLLNNCYFFYH